MNSPISHKILEIEQAIIKKNEEDFNMHSKDLRAMIRVYCFEKGYYNQTKL
jgi:hypothetical protein